MSTYHIHEGSYSLPAGWRDESMIIHTVGDPRGPAQFSVVMSRTRVNDGEDFVEFAERQLADLQRTLPDFSVLDQAQRHVGGQMALEASFSWASDRGPMQQRQVYVPAGPTVLVITATSLGRLDPARMAEVDALLASFRFRQGS